MKCNKHARDWPLWSAGDLSGRRLTRFQAHLAACPECAALAQAMETSSAQVATALSAPPADAPDAATWTRLQAKAIDAQRLRRWAWPTLAAAAAAVILGLLLWLPGRSPRQLLDGGQPDAGLTPVAPAQREVALVDAAEEADRYEMRLATSDPKVKIVWVFDRNLNI